MVQSVMRIAQPMVSGAWTGRAASVKKSMCSKAPPWFQDPVGFEFRVPPVVFGDSRSFKPVGLV